MATAEEIRTGAWSHRSKNLEKQKNNNRLEKGENLRLEEKMKCKGRVQVSLHLYKRNAKRSKLKIKGDLMEIMFPRIKDNQ